MTQHANKPFVCYITEHLIKKVTQSDNLKNVTSLILPYTKEKNEKIRFLENLQSLVNLQELIFSNHLISKIENLDKLVNLRELNLADNRITKLENLDKLVNLEELNLSGNRIDKIPKNITKNSSLKVLRLERNNITAIGDIAHLQSLVSLTNLALHPNPVTELPHYQDYTIFTVRTLHVLDGDSVSLDDRRKSIERFSRASEDKLKSDLEQLEGEHKGIRLQFDETSDLLRASRDKNQVLEAEVHKLREQNKTLVEENKICTILLEKKSAELTKVVAQHYLLQKEHAFYKLDNPFEFTKAVMVPNGHSKPTTPTIPKLGTNDVWMTNSAASNPEALKSLAKTLVSLKVKYNHVIDKYDIGKAQQEQALARLQTSIEQNLAFEREISLKIRQFHEHMAAHDTQRARAQVALAEGLRQSERLGDLLLVMDARVGERQTKLDGLTRRQREFLDQDQADEAEKIESDVQSALTDLRMWQSFLEAIETEHNITLRQTRLLEQDLVNRPRTSNDESLSDDGDLEDDVGILQAEVRAAEAKIDELKMETQNAERSVKVLLQQQKEQDEKIQAADNECKQIELEMQRIEHGSDAGADREPNSGQVENLLNQLRVKSDEIAKLHKQIAKLEANHAKYIASVKTLAVASLKTSSNFVPDLDTSTTNRTTSPSRTDSSFSTASPFRSGSPIKKSAERSEPVKVDASTETSFGASPYEPSLSSSSPISHSDDDEFADVRRDIASIAKHEYNHPSAFAIPQPTPPDPFLAYFSEKAISLIGELAKIEENRTEQTTMQNLREKGYTPSQIFDLLSEKVMAVSSSWKDLSENLTTTLEEALQTITNLNARIIELESAMVAIRITESEPRRQLEASSARRPPGDSGVEIEDYDIEEQVVEDEESEEEVVDDFGSDEQEHDGEGGNDHENYDDRLNSESSESENSEHLPSNRDSSTSKKSESPKSRNSEHNDEGAVWNGFLVPTAPLDKWEFERIYKLEADSESKDAKLSELTEEISRREERIAELEVQVQKLEEIVDGLDQRGTGLEADLIEKDRELLDLDRKVADLETNLAEKDELIADLNEEIERLEKVIYNTPDVSKEHQRSVAILERKVTDLEGELRARPAQEKVVNDLRERVQHLEEELKKKAKGCSEHSKSSFDVEAEYPFLLFYFFSFLFISHLPSRSQICLHLIMEKYASQIQALSAEMAQQHQQAHATTSELTAKVKQLEGELRRKLDEISLLSIRNANNMEKDRDNRDCDHSHHSQSDSQQVLMLKTLVGAKEDRLKAEELLRPDAAAQRRQVTTLMDTVKIQTKEIARLNDELQQYKQKYKQAAKIEAEEESERREELGNVSQELAKAKNELMAVQQKLIEYQKLLTVQLETTEKARAEGERASQATEHLRQQLDRTTQESENARQLVDKTMRELRDIDVRKADTHGALMTMEEAAKLLVEKSSELEMEKSRLEGEIQALRERVEKFGDKELEKQQSLAQITTRILDASAKLNATQEALADAERETADAQHHAERKRQELTNLETKAAEANRQVSEWRDKSAKLKSNLEQLQRKSEESSEEHGAVVKKLGSVLESVAQANLQIAAKNEELRQSTNAVYAMKRELDSASVELERVRAELKKVAKAEFLNWEVIDMEKEIERRREEFQRFMRGCADKESNISTKMAELDQVVFAKQTQVQEKETAQRSLERRVAELEQQCLVKKTELESMTKEYKQTVHETEEAKKQLSRTLLEVMEQKQNLELLRAQYQRAKEDSGKYLDICELSRVDLQKTKDEHDKVKRMIQEMVPALNASKADSAVVQQKLADLKKEMDELEREKTNIVHHNHMLKMENEKQERETARQRTEMVECLHKLDDLQTNLRSKKSALEKLDAQAQAQFLHQHQVLENGEISRLFEGEVARLQKQLEAVKTQNQLDLQNLQKVHAAKEARRKSKIGHLKKKFGTLQLEYSNHMELTQKQIVLLADSIKVDDLRRSFLEIGRIHRDMAQLLSQKVSEARKSHSHDFENPIKLAEIEKDAEISFLVAQLQKLQKEIRELERTASESQKLVKKFHNKLRKAEHELQKHNLYLPSTSTSSPSPTPSPLSIPSETPLPAPTRYSPSHTLSAASPSIPTTPPNHQPSSHPTRLSREPSLPLSSKPSSPRSSKPSSPPPQVDLSQHSLPVSSNSPPFSSSDLMPSSHQDPPYSSPPPPCTSDGYVLAQIPRPNKETHPSQKGNDKTTAKKSSATEKSPVALEKENSKLREQCDSLTHKLYKSQQMFIQKLTELQGDREELKTRLERLENSPPQSSPSPVHSASPYPPQSYIPSSALPSFPRHVPPHQRMTSPSIPSSHPRPSPSPQYVTPEDWIFSRPSLHE